MNNERSLELFELVSEADIRSLIDGKTLHNC